MSAKYFLFSSRDRFSGLRRIIEQQWWSVAEDSKEKLLKTNIQDGDKIVFFSTPEKRFCFVSEVDKGPLPFREASKFNSYLLTQNKYHNKHFLLLKNIKHIDKILNERLFNELKILHVFGDRVNFKNRSSVGNSIRRSPRKKIDKKAYEVIMRNSYVDNTSFTSSRTKKAVRIGHIFEKTNNIIKRFNLTFARNPERFLKEAEIQCELFRHLVNTIKGCEVYLESGDEESKEIADIEIFPPNDDKPLLSVEIKYAGGNDSFQKIKEKILSDADKLEGCKGFLLFYSNRRFFSKEEIDEIADFLNKKIKNNLKFIPTVCSMKNIDDIGYKYRVV